MTWVSSRTTGLVIKSRCRDLVEAQVEDTGPGRETGKRKRGAAATLCKIHAGGQATGVHRVWVGAQLNLRLSINGL
jgi:hypothetical protein